MMNLKTVERISKALGDPYRLMILQQVKKKECAFCADIVDSFDLSQSTIAHHLKQLVDTGLLIPGKEGRNVKYTVDKQVLTDYMDFLGELKG
jgi:DNA-binding transcriptional ArsR family regulator